MLKIRFPDSIFIEIDESISSDKSMLCTNCLLILIENAIKHNIHTESNPLYIKIINNENHIVISNNINRKNIESVESFGFGQAFLKHNLELLKINGFEIENDDNNYSVKIPKFK